MYQIRKPWHFWPMVALALLWYGFLALNYLMWQIELRDWLRLFPDRYVSYFVSLPLWAYALWAIAVWSGFLGALLLAGGVAGAPLALAIGFLGMLFLTIALLFVFPGLSNIVSSGDMALIIGGIALSAAIWAYAREEKQVGIID